jgi:predicted DNA-binding protein with PD1-like motif
MLCFMLALALQLTAQETRREIVNPAPVPADDAKPNSDKVPDVYAISGRFDRVLVLRFKRDTDLLAGLQKMVKQEGVKNATGAADLIGINAYVMDGRVHAHITLATPARAFGGHLEPGTTVFTFAVVTLGVMNEGVDFTHLDDRNYR